MKSILNSTFKIRKECLLQQNSRNQYSCCSHLQSINKIASLMNCILLFIFYYLHVCIQSNQMDDQHIQPVILLNPPVMHFTGNLYKLVISNRLECLHLVLASSPGSLLKNGGRREPGNIRGKSCRLPARHDSCDQRRTLPL